MQTGTNLPWLAVSDCAVDVIALSSVHLQGVTFKQMSSYVDRTRIDFPK
nr:unnamed protein product [Callosobruchus chinensis]